MFNPEISELTENVEGLTDKVGILASDMASLKAQLGAFQNWQAWLAFVTDAKACGKRLDELSGLVAQAIKAKAEAEAAEASLASAKAAQEAELAVRKAELDSFHASVTTHAQNVLTSRETVFLALSEMQRLDNQMRRAVMSYGGILDGYNERISELPSWKSLNQDLLGIADAHMDGNEGSARPETSSSNVVPDNLVEGSTLTRRSARPRPSRADA
ncbi:MAG TPA: hypothetical protein VFB02_16470 [Bradyrhizobium sp.]|nr:hypothetical protein [Bradyrhizobium sp.]